MTNKTLLSRAAGFVCAAAALGIAGAPAIAEQAGIQEVTVIAERPTTTVVGRTSSGAAIELLELRHRVSFADLNLATHAGATDLEKRVSNAAKSACDELDKLYPLEAKEANCAKKAADAAMSQVHAAVAAAEQRAKAGTK
jgi:UrcA family protein